MKWGLITVGNEIIQGRILDTNKQNFSKMLHSYGYDFSLEISIGDIKEDIENSIDFF